ncbi:MAG: hypothetical protein K8S99_02730 [Planctomycetes bacterium]|nr:hypothetical protein [Planctomycetota bacterium]
MNNEVKDICYALAKIGVPKSIQEMFRTDIYPVRSAQVMHAWQKQVSIDAEVVGKIKLLCDAAMFHAFEPCWRDTIEKLNGLPSSGS